LAILTPLASSLLPFEAAAGRFALAALLDKPETGAVRPFILVPILFLLALERDRFGCFIIGQSYLITLFFLVV
jgi:hypothetical protein